MYQQRIQTCPLPPTQLIASAAVVEALYCNLTLSLLHQFRWVPPVDDSDIDNLVRVAEVHLPVLCTLLQAGGACVSLTAAAAIHSQV